MWARIARFEGGRGRRVSLEQYEVVLERLPGTMPS